MYPRVLFLILLIAVQPAFADSCRVVGSDWLEPVLAPMLPQRVAEAGVDIQLDLRGSIPAKQQIRAGAADVAIIASSEKLDFGSDWRVIPFGFEVAMIAVHLENPLREISYEQLRGIFGVSENINRWTDLGLTGVWSTRSIVPLMLPRGMGSSVLFRHDVLKGGALRPTVRAVDSAEDLIQRVDMDSGAIAVFPYTDSVETVRLLAVSDDRKESVPFNPTQENIFYGDYPLRLPLYLVFPAQANSCVLKVVQVLLGEDLAMHIARAGVCPLPKKVRERTLLELDIK